MKRFISAAAVIALLAAGTIDAQAASKKASANATTAQLNQQQLQLNGNAQEAAAPSQQAPMPMPQAGQAGTYVNGKYVPPGARCGADNPNCAQQLNNPAVNSATQLRLQGAQ